MESVKKEQEPAENNVSAPETCEESVKKAAAKKPAVSEKRRLKRHVCIDLSDCDSSSESGADDHTVDGTIGLEHFKNDSTKWESGLLTQRTASTTRKLTR